MPGQPEEVNQEIELEMREKAIVLAALSDEEFMKGVLEAYRLEASGEQGEPWSDVKARFGLV